MQQIPDDVFFQQMRTILKPMVDSTLSENPKDPVNNIKYKNIIK